jgi:hypothetical protein
VSAIGLNWAGLLRRWQSALFFAATLLAYDLAMRLAPVLAAIAGGEVGLKSGEFAVLVLGGCIAGLIGSLVAYFGLTLVNGSWRLNTLKNIAVFSVLLALAGGGFLTIICSVLVVLKARITSTP